MFAVPKFPGDGYHHHGSNGTGLSRSSWLDSCRTAIKACMASVLLFASATWDHKLRVFSPYSCASLACGMVTPSTASMRATSSTVTLSVVWAMDIHDVDVIVRCNWSTNCLYIPQVANNSASRKMNVCLARCTLAPLGALPNAICIPCTDDSEMPSCA